MPLGAIASLRVSPPSHRSFTVRRGLNRNFRGTHLHQMECRKRPVSMPSENAQPKRTRTGHHSGRRANGDQSPSTCCAAPSRYSLPRVGFLGSYAAGLRICLGRSTLRRSVNQMPSNPTAHVYLIFRCRLNNRYLDTSIPPFHLSRWCPICV